jgi:hypothetical protein
MRFVYIQGVGYGSLAYSSFKVAAIESWACWSYELSSFDGPFFGWPSILRYHGAEVDNSGCNHFLLVEPSSSDPSSLMQLLLLPGGRIYPLFVPFSSLASASTAAFHCLLLLLLRIARFTYPSSTELSYRSTEIAISSSETPSSTIDFLHVHGHSIFILFF